MIFANSKIITAGAAGFEPLAFGVGALRQDLEFRHRFPGGIGGQLDVQYRITSGSGEIFKQSLI